MDQPSRDTTHAGRRSDSTSPQKSHTSRLSTTQAQHFAPTPPPGLGPARWPPNEDGHICELTNIFGRCLHCSWSERMHNPLANTHYDRPIALEPRYVKPGLHPPPSWPADFEWTVPYGVLEPKSEPEGFARFDPRCMLWWLQWEIVFARSEMNFSDDDTCLLFRYRWMDKDPSVRYMQPYHVPEILKLLSDGNRLHAHAFWFQSKERELAVREEWRKASNELRVAKEDEWNARCREWEPGQHLAPRAPVGAVGDKKLTVQDHERRTRELEVRTKMLEAKRRNLEIERWEMAPRTAVMREEFASELARASQWVLYGRRRGGYQ